MTPCTQVDTHVYNSFLLYSNTFSKYKLAYKFINLKGNCCQTSKIKKLISKNSLTSKSNFSNEN